MTPAAATALYLGGSAAVFCAAPRACLARRWAGKAATVALLALALRLTLATFAPGNYDIRSYELVMRALDRGEVVYEATERYNYSPVWFHVLWATQRLARATGTYTGVLIRALTTSGDVLVALALAWVFRRRGSRRRAAATALLYFTNPVSIAISSGHGQFDALAVAPAVLALGFALPGATLIPALLLGAGAAVKQVVLLFAPVLLGFSRDTTTKARDLLLAGLPFALLLLPWAVAFPAAVERNVVRYAGVTGIWGFTTLVGWPFPFPRAVATFGAALLGAALGWRLARRTGDGLLGARAAALGFFALTSGFGHQMLLWPLAFAPAKRERPAVLAYTAAGLGAYAVFFLRHDAWFPALTAAWLASLWWLLLLVRGARSAGAVRGMNRHAA